MKRFLIILLLFSAVFCAYAGKTVSGGTCRYVKNPLKFYGFKQVRQSKRSAGRGIRVYVVKKGLIYRKRIYKGGFYR